jgi:hypothetical protein
MQTVRETGRCMGGRMKRECKSGQENGIGMRGANVMVQADLPPHPSE